MRRILVPVFTIALLSQAIADDFKTSDGKEYHGTVSRAEPDGIVVITDSGIVKLYFAELPKETRDRFHFDPAKAVEFAKQDAAVQERLQSAAATERAEQARKAAEYWASVERQKHQKATDQTQELTRDGKYHNPLEEGPVHPFHLVGRVISKTGEGLIVSTAESGRGRGSIGKDKKTGEVIYLMQHPDFAVLADDDKISVNAVLVGTFEYESVDGAARTVKSYSFISR